MKINNPEEALFYKIEKRQFGYNADALINTYWIDPIQTDYLRFIDSQIKYGEEYYYKVYAYILNISNIYTYSSYYNNNNSFQKLVDIKNGIYKVKFNSMPKYELLEIELFRTSSSVTENPYTKPKAKFSKHDIGISIDFLESNSEELEEYKALEDKDFNILEAIKRSQKNVKNNVLYKNNISGERKVEIYKTFLLPTNISSFQGTKYKTVVLKNSNTLIDKIQPEIPFYYMFRYLNKYGAPSNPSPIYKVLLKEDEGTYSLEVSEYSIDDKIDNKLYKNFKKYLLIRPSIIQMQINKYNNSNTIQDIYLGPEANNIWNDENSNVTKDFILRIKSKKTNRILEFNLKSIINRKNI